MFAMHKKTWHRANPLYADYPQGERDRRSKCFAMDKIGYKTNITTADVTEKSTALGGRRVARLRAAVRSTTCSACNVNGNRAVRSARRLMGCANDDPLDKNRHSHARTSTSVSRRATIVTLLDEIDALRKRRAETIEECAKMCR